MTISSLKKQLTGIIVSDKMPKTVIVRVESVKVHPKYQKRYKVFKKFPAHTEGGEYRIGDRVVIEEHKPISRTKHWLVVRKA